MAVTFNSGELSSLINSPQAFSTQSVGTAQKNTAPVKTASAVDKQPQLSSEQLAGKSDKIDAKKIKPLNYDLFVGIAAGAAVAATAMPLIAGRGNMVKGLQTIFKGGVKLFEEKLSKIIEIKDAEIKEISNLAKSTLQKSDEKIAGLTTSLGKADEKIAGLTTSLGKSDEKIAGLTTSLGKADEKIAGLTTSLGKSDEKIAGLTTSLSKAGEEVSTKIIEKPQEHEPFIMKLLNKIHNSDYGVMSQGVENKVIDMGKTFSDIERGL